MEQVAHILEVVRSSVLVNGQQVHAQLIDRRGGPNFGNPGVIGTSAGLALEKRVREQKGTVITTGLPYGDGLFLSLVPDGKVRTVAQHSHASFTNSWRGTGAVSHGGSNKGAI
jgi:hypothetical protein